MSLLGSDGSVFLQKTTEFIDTEVGLADDGAESSSVELDVGWDEWLIL